VLLLTSRHLTSPHVMNSIPSSIIFASLIFVVIPGLIAVFLRWSCYQYLSRLNNDLSRLLDRIDRTMLSDRLTGIMNHLHRRYEEVSLKTDRVNTIALVEVVYAEQRIRWPFGKITLERIDSYTRVLPNLLLSFGLIGTFIGITTNLVSLGKLINTTNASDINDLVQALQSPLEGMGVAFISSLVALIASAFLITVNLFWNITTEKNKLISGFENYLDNIYQVTLNGESKLDKTIDRMANTFDRFLIDFGDSLKKSVESALRDKIQEISDAYIKVADIAAQSYSKFDDTSSHIAKSADRFQSSSLILHQAVKEINESQFAQSLAKTTAAMKATLGEFEISSQRLSITVGSVEKTFTQSHIGLAKSIDQLAGTQDAFATSIKNLNQSVDGITKGTRGFEEAAIVLQQSAKSINDSEFSQSLMSATTGLKQTVTNFQSSSKHLADTMSGVRDFIGASNTQFVSSITELSIIQNSFTASTHSLEVTVASLHNSLVDKIEKISTSYIGVASLAGEAYSRLNHISDTIAHSTTDLKDAAVIFKESAHSFETADFDKSFQTFSGAIIAMRDCVDGSTNLLSTSITTLSQVQSNFEQSSTNLHQSVSVLQTTLTSLMTNSIQEISTSYNGIATLATQVYEKLDRTFETIDRSTNNIQSSSLVFQQTIQALENTQFTQSLLSSTAVLADSALKLTTSSAAFQRSADVLQEQRFTEALTSSVADLKNLQSDFRTASDGLRQTFGAVVQTIHTFDQTGQQSLAAIEKISNLSDLQQTNQQHLNDVIPKISHSVTSFNDITHAFRDISGQISQHNSDLGSYLQTRNQSSHGIEHRLGEAIEQLNNISSKVERIESISTSNFRDFQEALNANQKRGFFR
jgi:methyl-accepting chemotaxis protein